MSHSPYDCHNPISKASSNPACTSNLDPDTGIPRASMATIEARRARRIIPGKSRESRASRVARQERAFTTVIRRAWMASRLAAVNTLRYWALVNASFR